MEINDIDIEDWKPPIMLSYNIGNNTNTKNKCHICDKEFDQLDIHFLELHLDEIEEDCGQGEHPPPRTVEEVLLHELQAAREQRETDHGEARIL